jgi:Zn-dependent protease with chaperone function
MRASSAFYSLVTLAAVGVGLLAAGLYNLAMHFMPAAALWTRLCGKLFAVAADLGYPVEVVGGPLVGVAALTLGAGARALVGQVRATRRLVDALTYPRVLRHPPTLAAAVARLGLVGRVDLVASPRWYVFCYGFLRPRVCLTTGLVAALDAAELTAVLAHEQRHVAQRDPLRLLVAQTLRGGVFYLQALEDLNRRFRRAVELDADRQAVGVCGDVALASAMYKLLKGPALLRLDPAVAVGALSVTAERVEQLIHPQRRRGEPLSAVRLALTGLALLVLVLVGLPLDHDRNLADAGMGQTPAVRRHALCPPAAELSSTAVALHGHIDHACGGPS